MYSADFRTTLALIRHVCVLFMAITLASLGGSARLMADVNKPSEPDRLDPEAVAWIEESLAGLDLRQRVSQLVFPWIPGGSISRSSAEYRRLRGWILEDQVGGLIVSRGAANEFAPMLNDLQSISALPLLIISDLETGPSMRLTGGTNVPPAMALGAANSEALAYDAGRLTGIEARAAGIHATLGPVLDVNSNPLNPIINTRSFGEDPALVARIAGAWIAGAKSAGLLTIPKHFPGHGATEIDSHIGLPTVNAVREELDSIDLYPFRIAAGGGVDGVLVGHIAVPAVDGPNAPPASLSPKIVTDILRRSFAFEGLVITDALNMGAITESYSVAEASILALLAGVDALLQPPGERAVIDAIVAAVTSGRIPQERIDEAARRVLTAKAAAGLHRSSATRATGGSAPAGHARTANEVAAASLTLVRDHSDLIPLVQRRSSILHVAYSGDASRFTAPTFSAALRTAGHAVDVHAVNSSTTAATYRGLTERAARSDFVIVSANLVPREYRGALALQDRYSRFVEALITSGVPVIAVSFGSPYLLDFFPSVPAYLIAWSSGAASQRAAAAALVGQLPISGKLPVSLPPYHLIGEGLSRDSR